jgi:hypothetical protein
MMQGQQANQAIPVPDQETSLPGENVIVHQLLQRCTAGDFRAMGTHRP